MKIVLPDQIDLKEEHISELKSLGDVEIYDDTPTEELLIERIQGAELIFGNWIDITEKVIKSTPSLKYIIVPAVGYEWVDVTAARDAGVTVLNCPTHNANAVAEHAIGLMLSVARQSLNANNELKAGKWSHKYVGVELRGKTLGLIGFGKIGRNVGKLAEGFGMNVQSSNSKSSPDEIDTIISSSDFVCLTLPLNESSHHLIDERRLRLMKKSAYLINTSRGAIVDQESLLKVLKEGVIAGAGLDVFEDEPLTGGQLSPEIMELIHLENVVATPHIAFNTVEAKERMGEEIIQNVKSCIEGKPINVVNL